MKYRCMDKKSVDLCSGGDQIPCDGIYDEELNTLTFGCAEPCRFAMRKGGHLGKVLSSGEKDA